MGKEMTPEGVEIPPGFRKGDRRMEFGALKPDGIRVGYCPCDHCEHVYMWDCDPDAQVQPDGSKLGCQCCRGTCT